MCDPACWRPVHCLFGNVHFLGWSRRHVGIDMSHDAVTAPLTCRCCWKKSGDDRRRPAHGVSIVGGSALQGDTSCAAAFLRPLASPLERSTKSDSCFPGSTQLGPALLVHPGVCRLHEVSSQQLCTYISQGQLSQPSKTCLTGSALIAESNPAISGFERAQLRSIAGVVQPFMTLMILRTDSWAGHVVGAGDTLSSWNLT